MVNTKRVCLIALLSAVITCLTGCDAVGKKTASLSIVYAATALVSLLLLFICFFLKSKNRKWLLLLFSSISIVNCGYFLLACSDTLNQALWANRLSYLGSVFLPMAMLIIILNTIKIKYKKWLPIFLTCVGFFVFLVTASPGYSDIYYKEVAIETVNGITILDKEYGSWHVLYLVYLVSYFAVMMFSAVYAIVKKRIESVAHTTMLMVAVFLNIGIWLLEQLVKLDFELLSVSYIVSELFLLGLDRIMFEIDKLKVPANAENTSSRAMAANGADRSVRFTKTLGVSDARFETFIVGLSLLTETERNIYRYYVEGKSTKEIADLLKIKESTLGFCSQNMYCKLGVVSRKQLVEISKYVVMITK